MAVKYADRAFISVNGLPLADVQSASLRQNLNARAVPSMTTDGFNTGFVQGNRDIEITCQLALRNEEARAKLESINFETNDVQMTFQVGSDQFVATGLFLRDVEDNAGGVGDEVKTTFNFSALRLQDAVGNSALFSLEFAA